MIHLGKVELVALDVDISDFAMIGNSLKSDILPVLELGGLGFHIPYHVTWEHERVHREIKHKNLFQLEQISELPKYFDNK